LIKNRNKSSSKASGEEQIVVTLRVYIEGKQEVHAIQYLWVLGLINRHKILVKVRWLALALL
jgi:head-tail adaptor